MNHGDLKTAYIGSVSGQIKRGTPCRHLLLGGVGIHDSAPFASRKDAQAWTDTVKQTNIDAGRKIGSAEVSEVLVRDSVEIIPASDNAWHNTGGNGPAREVWVRRNGARAAIVHVMPFRCMVDFYDGHELQEEGRPAATLEAGKAYGDSWLA